MLRWHCNICSPYAVNFIHVDAVAIALNLVRYSHSSGIPRDSNYLDCQGENVVNLHSKEYKNNYV